MSGVRFRCVTGWLTMSCTLKIASFFCALRAAISSSVEAAPARVGASQSMGNTMQINLIRRPWLKEAIRISLMPKHGQPESQVKREIYLLMQLFPDAKGVENEIKKFFSGVL